MVEKKKLYYGIVFKVKLRSENYILFGGERKMEKFSM